MSYVVVDDAEGGRLATEHLVKRGHRRVLHIAGPLSLSDARGRLDGYKKALMNSGIAFDESLVKVLITAKMQNTFKLMKKILSNGVDFTAVSCHSDYVAMAVMKALREKGLRIPDDVAVVGYDDVEVASLLEVPLTTIHTPKYTLGNRTVEVPVDGVLNKKSKGLRQTVMKPRLVIRKSA